MTAVVPEPHPLRVHLDAPPIVFRGLRQVLGDYPDRVRCASRPQHVVCDVRVAMLAGEGRPEPTPGRGPTQLRLPPLVYLAPRVAPGSVERARAGGAARLVPIDAAPERLLRAIESCHDDPTWQAPEPTDRGGLARRYGLSPREADMMAWICAGHSNDDIARRLYLSINSVKTYIRSLYRKLGLSSRAQAVAWGVQHGF